MDWGGAPLKFCPGSENQMKSKNYKQQILTLALAALASSPALAQVASHEPTGLKPMVASSAAPATAPTASANLAGPGLSPVQPVTNRPVVRINGTELTDRDLLREMLIIFPYARQHNGFPKAEEPKIRMGALKMIEFEELVYQEAERRGMTVPAATLQKAQTEFRAQFPDQEAFDGFLKTEMQGSKQALRQQIRRSLLVDQFLKAEVTDKAKVTLAETRAYYDKNPNVFRYSENFNIQTISILPSDKAGDEVKKQARQGAEAACQKAKATKSYQEFGLLAEKVSEDDFHVNMGDHKTIDRDKLPPEIVKAAQSMQAGQVSDLLQLGNFYTCFRLNAHAPAGKRTFAEVKDALRQSLEREKSERLRAGLDQKLRQTAKVQEL
jgi:parvulin-like peptidyl-prolyl isomerase